MGLKSDDLARLSPAAQKQIMEKMRKPGKYKAQKTKRGKLTFDSKKEAERYDALMLLQKAGRYGASNYRCGTACKRRT